MSKAKLMISPHIHCGQSTTGIMLDVLIALLPATVAGAVIFGWRALLVVAVCLISCVGFEALFNLLTKKDLTIIDLSAAVTGLLLALNLPANIPLWQCVVGSLFAIVVVKCLFGGIGCNLVNPAIAARVFMLVAFAEVAKAAFPALSVGAVDTVATATPLNANGIMPSLLDLFLGLRGGAIGETCVAALLLGGIYLLIRRVITWHTPVAFIATVFVFSLFLEMDYSLLQNAGQTVFANVLAMLSQGAVAALSKVMCGGVVIGAIFMATDYTTSPSTPWGKFLFGVGCGLMTCLIRLSAAEGVSYAILFMNIVNPYIKSWTKFKVFGVGGAK